MNPENMKRTDCDDSRKVTQDRKRPTDPEKRKTRIIKKLLGMDENL